MLSAASDWAPIYTYGKYELMVAAFTNYVPVTTGIIGFFVIMMLPFILGAKEKVIGKKEIPLGPPEETAEQIEEKEELQAFNKSKKELLDIEVILSGEMPDIAKATDNLEQSILLAGKIELPRFKGAAYKAIGERYNAMGDISLAQKYLELSYTTYKKGKRTKDCAGLAHTLADLYLQKREPGSALDYARRAILHFEQVDLPEEAEKMTVLIKQIKSA